MITTGLLGTHLQVNFAYNLSAIFMVIFILGVGGAGSRSSRHQNAMVPEYCANATFI